MTEYTSWDNYVKEQEQKKAMSKQWRNEYTFMADLNPHTASNFRLHERVKKSEDEIATLDNVLLEIKHKVKDLDTKIDYDRIILDNFANSIDELRKKIKDLETSHRCDANNDLYNRVIALESKKDVLDSLFNKVIALEEWKDTKYKGLDDLGLEDVQRRVKDLEEWKRLVEDKQKLRHEIKETSEVGISDHSNWSKQYYKVIDKKVWEEIKSDIHLMAEYLEKSYWNTPMATIARNLLSHIKKADPTFCEND